MDNIPNRDMDQVWSAVNECSGRTINHPTAYSTLTEFRRVCEYLFSQAGEKWPFQSTRFFNTELRKHPQLNNLLFDTETTKPKIAISFAKELRTLADDHHKALNPHKSSGNKGVTPEVWNDVVAGTDLPTNKINLQEHSAVIKPMHEMLNDKHPVVALVTAPGLGKTESIVEFINQHWHGNAVAVSFRCALAEKQTADYFSAGFMSYQDDRLRDQYIHIGKVKRLVVQVDSLYRVVFENDSDYDNTILILDELESIIEHIYTSPYLTKNQGSIVRKLAEMIKRCRRVIIADASLTASTLKFLEHHCKRPVYVYKNTFVRNERRVVFYGGRGQLTDEIVNAVREGKKLFVPTNSRAAAQFIASQVISNCPGVKCKVYDKDTVLEKGCDPISDMIHFDVCIATPKFQAGNSFTAEHFDRVYAYFTAASCSPFAAFQLMLRVRNLREPEIHVYVDNRVDCRKIKPDSSISSMEDLQTKLSKRIETAFGHHTFVLALGQNTEYTSSRTGVADFTKPLWYLKSVCEYNMNEGFKDYASKLIALMKGAGMVHGGNKADQMSEEAEKDFSKSMKAQREEMEKQQNEDIANAQDINPIEAGKLQVAREKGDQLTQEQKDSLRKYELLQSIRLLNPNDPAAVKEAREVRRCKALVQQMVQLLALSSGAQQADIYALVSRFIYKNTGLDPLEPGGSSKISSFYTMEHQCKTLRVLYMWSMMQTLGFGQGIFDTSQIVMNVDGLVTYIKTGKDAIECAFSHKFTQKQLSGSSLVRWLNEHLHAIFRIKLVNPSKKGIKSPYCIQSPWVIVPEQGGLVKHSPLEIEVPPGAVGQAMPDIVRYITLYQQRQMEPIVDGTPNFLPMNEAMAEIKQSVTFRQDLGKYVIYNGPLWDHCIKKYAQDAEVMTYAYKMYQSHKLVADYLKSKGDRPSSKKSFDKYIERQSKASDNSSVKLSSDPGVKKTNVDEQGILSV